MENVYVFFEGKKILGEISWQLKPGEHWAIIGPNGAGKSTFLKVIRGDVWPWPQKESARIYHFGREPQTTLIGIKKHIALVTPELQDAYIRNNWEMKGEEVVYTGFLDTVWLYEKPTKAQISYAEDLMEFLNVKNVRKRSFIELSRGEARKVLIARALVSHPRILILDEFCNGLDAESRKNVLDLLEHVVQDGTQIIYATHRNEEFIPSISHLLHLEGGTIKKQGRKQNVLTKDRSLSSDVPNLRLGISKRPISPVQRAGISKRDEKCLIKIKNADVYLDDRRILRGINWQLKSGENWALLGKNGAGKSTFLKLISGDLHPALGGEVRRFGRKETGSIWDVKKKIGFVSSDLQACYPNTATGEEVVRSGFFSSIGLYSGVSKKQREAVKKNITFFKLEEIRRKSVCEMSYGEFRKILIARAIVNAPDILVLDEPCSGLDKLSREDLFDFLDRVCRSNTSIILATHHLDELIPSITHVMLLGGGQIVAQGKKEEILPRVMQELSS